MKKLSVIVPVFNVSSLIVRCIDSLINQSYLNLEIIIVNDGSTDDSYEYIKQYLNYPQIKYIYQKNQGLGQARNVGMHNSTGDYISFVDSDDWVDLDLYQIMIREMEQSKTDIALCGIKNEYNNYISSNERYNYPINNVITGRKALCLLSRSDNNNYLISPVVWNKIYNKELLLKNNLAFLKRSYWEDDVFSFQTFMEANSVCVVPNVYYHYYQREGSITKRFSKKHIDDLIEAFQILYKYIENYDNPIINIKNILDNYFDRAITSLMNMLFLCEPSNKSQKEYIIYFFQRFSKCFSLEKALIYLDTKRIQRLFI